MITVKDLLKYEDYIIQMRRDFHKHPETGFKEFRTSKVIKAELESFGFEIIDGIGGTGLIGILKGNPQGKTIAVRADIDALSMQEELVSEYKSENEGVMHSCGHDTHMAMLLGACKYYSEHKDQVNGTIKFIFQAAEEGPMPGGGKILVEAGHIDDCDGVFGLHITTKYPKQTVNVKKGPAMAAPDEFKITVTGVGTHASAPHTGIDPILISAQIISALQSIVSRSVSPTDSAVVSVCTINGGTAFNIIPESVNFSGTIRTLNPLTRAKIFKQVEDIVNNICQMHGASGITEIIPAYPPLINDIAMSDFVIDIAQRLIGHEFVTVLDEPSMGGEDFAYYLEKKPGSYFWLGAGLSDNEPYNHNPLFNPDEKSFIIGTAMHINIIKEFLK